MAKSRHEFRDPVHAFIYVDGDERRIIDSKPVQRLRHIHQLAMTYLVYPGATHRRFEHSLGVMELAGRVFDVITNQENIHPDLRESFSYYLPDDRQRLYWRTVVRIAALCHDVGHLPFSHAAEHDLLPHGQTHEKLTVQLILSEEMKRLWSGVKPPISPEDVAQVAVGPEHYEEPLSEWHNLLSDIITGDALGVDRMDYLLRDSLHAGVAYGRFDHYRLIDTIRVLPSPGGGSLEPQLGVTEGGLHAAEALLLARYFMYSQVYFHPIRRIYDVHLKDFLVKWLEDKGGAFPTDPSHFLAITDAEVLAAINYHASHPGSGGHDPAQRILGRGHFKVLWSWNPDDVELNPDAGDVIYRAVGERFGLEVVRRDRHMPKEPDIDFPVLQRDRQTVVSAKTLSKVLQQLPSTPFDYVFVDRDHWDDANAWLMRSKNEILESTP